MIKFKLSAIMAFPCTRFSSPITPAAHVNFYSGFDPVVTFTPQLTFLLAQPSIASLQRVDGILNGETS